MSTRPPLSLCETSVSGQASTNPHQFTGRENDGTGLHYYRARYYHPGLGRFISEDPIRFAGGSANLYAYVRNNAPSLVDPLGLFNLIGGAGGSLVGGTGGEASGGIYINPGGGSQAPAAGLFGSAGPAFGVNVSGDGFVGFILGGVSNISGITGNLNIGVGYLSLTFMFNDSGFVGLTLGAGPSALLLGGSASFSMTRTCSFYSLAL